MKPRQFTIRVPTSQKSRDPDKVQVNRARGLHYTRGSGDIAPPLLELLETWYWLSGQLHVPAAYSPRTNPCYPLYRTLGGPQGRSGRSGDATYRFKTKIGTTKSQSLASSQCL